MQSKRSPTNTIVLTNVSEQVLRDPSELMSFIAVAVPSTTLELVSLPLLSRIVLICRSKATSVQVKSLLDESAEWASIRTSFSVADSAITNDESVLSEAGALHANDKGDNANDDVSNPSEQTLSRNHSTYLELPLEEGSRRFLISPPVSPPAGWNYWDKVEEGPNTKAVHSPEQLSHLLWERLGGLDGVTACKYREETEGVQCNAGEIGEARPNPVPKEIVDISHGQEILFKDIHTNVPAIMLDPVDSETRDTSLHSTYKPTKCSIPKTAMPSSSAGCMQDSRPEKMR